MVIGLGSGLNVERILLYLYGVAFQGAVCLRRRTRAAGVPRSADGAMRGAVSRMGAKLYVAPGAAIMVAYVWAHGKRTHGSLQPLPIPLGGSSKPRRTAAYPISLIVFIPVLSARSKRCR